MPLVPLPPFSPDSPLQTPIIEVALGRLCLHPRSADKTLSAEQEDGTALVMKPIRIVLSPTHSRPVNMFLGLVLMLVALLLFLASGDLSRL
jgi:uncharacterized membrane protein